MTRTPKVMRFGDMRQIGILLALAMLWLPASVSAREKDAALVMDASTGKVLYSRNADEPRYPASLTKMMTLYLLFEAIEKGDVSLSTQMTASPEAASQKPTRLGVQSGDTVTVEEAIKALVIRSANDAAVIVAEQLAGNEDRFAIRMTQKARELGMYKTTFRNASGLPDAQQESTAMDMATLSRRLQTDFAKYYPYFSQRSFVWNGRTYGGHNRLLNHFEGADGLKTGYTRLSGYNLATSAQRRGTRLIGVVLGGPSSYSRDVQMAEMLETQYSKLGLGRPASIVVAMSPLVPDEDEMEGTGSRQVVIESAVEARPPEMPSVAPASLNSSSLAPILPRTRQQIQPSAPVAASLVETDSPVVTIRMSPVVPDEIETKARKRNQRGRPVSDAGPSIKRQTLTIASLTAAEAPVRNVAADPIAKLINTSKPSSSAKPILVQKPKVSHVRSKVAAKKSGPLKKTLTRAAQPSKDKKVRVAANTKSKAKTDPIAQKIKSAKSAARNAPTKIAATKTAKATAKVVTRRIASR